MKVFPANFISAILSSNIYAKLFSFLLKAKPQKFSLKSSKKWTHETFLPYIASSFLSCNCQWISISKYIYIAVECWSILGTLDIITTLNSSNLASFPSCSHYPCTLSTYLLIYTGPKLIHSLKYYNHQKAP